MPINSLIKKTLALIIFCSLNHYSFSQNNVINQSDSQEKAPNLRGDNAITGAIGLAVMNGDYPNALFEFYGQIGYKRFVSPFINVNIGYNKFNLAFEDLANNGFMSFDLNVEGLLFPDKQFTPYAFAGLGLNASNYFKQTDIKTQFGVGIEYLIAEEFGIKLFTDYNYVFSDLVDGREYGGSDDVIWRLAIGFNFYFGGRRTRVIPEGTPTIINSNLIKHNN